MKKAIALGLGAVLMGLGCGSSRDLADLPPYPEAFQREWFDAQRDLAKGDFEEAYSALIRCSALEPDEPAIPFQLGKIDYDAERFSAALVHFNHALNLGSEDPWMHHYRALTHLALGNEKDALADILPLIESRKGDIDYALNWVDDCREAGMLEAGIRVCDVFETTSAKDSDVSYARLGLIGKQGDTKKILETLQGMVAAFPNVIEFRAYLGSLLLDLDQPWEALDALKSAEELDPYNGRVQFELGDWYLNEQNDRKAVEYYTKAFASDEVSAEEMLNVLNYYMQFIYSPTVSAPLRPLLAAALSAKPGNAEMLMMAAEVALKDDDTAKALELLKRAVEQEPQRVGAWKRLVQLDAMMQDWEALRADAEKAIVRFPTQPELLLQAGIAAKALGNPELAIHHCESALDYSVFDDPSLEFRIRVALGDALNAAGKPLLAAEQYDLLLEMEPTNATIWNNQAWYLAQAGVELDRALTAIQRAVKLQPGVAIFEDTYAWVLHLMGDHEGAIEWITRALASDANGGSAGMWENAGDIHEAAGNDTTAKEAWTRAKELGANKDRMDEKINRTS